MCVALQVAAVMIWSTKHWIVYVACIFGSGMSEKLGCEHWQVTFLSSSKQLPKNISSRCTPHTRWWCVVGCARLPTLYAGCLQAHHFIRDYQRRWRTLSGKKQEQMILWTQVELQLGRFKTHLYLCRGWSSELMFVRHKEIIVIFRPEAAWI